MKTLLTILFFMIFGSVQAQTHIHTPVIDTVEQLIPVMDSSRIWSYYHGDGRLAWGNVKGYDATLIPVGGYAVKGKLLKPQFYAVDGFIVTITDCCNRMETVMILDVNKQPLKKPLMVVWPFNIPINGTNL